MYFNAYTAPTPTTVTQVLHMSYPHLEVCVTQIHIIYFDYTITNIDKRILNIVSVDKRVQNNIL